MEHGASAVAGRVIARLSFAGPIRLGGQSSGAIVGQLVDTEGAPIAGGARMRMVELHRSWLPHQDGVFSFAQIPAGEHPIAVDAIGYRSRQQVVRVVADTVRMRVEVTRLLVELSPVVITGTIGAGAEKVGGADLDRRLEGTVAATLRANPESRCKPSGPSPGGPSSVGWAATAS